MMLKEPDPRNIKHPILLLIKKKVIEELPLHSNMVWLIKRREMVPRMHVSNHLYSDEIPLNARMFAGKCGSGSDQLPARWIGASIS
jgi:hypothetical protein